LAGLLWPVLRKLGLAGFPADFVMEREVIRFSPGTA
jgi:hypothetical protein